MGSGVVTGTIDAISRLGPSARCSTAFSGSESGSSLISMAKNAALLAMFVLAKTDFDMFFD